MALLCHLILLITRLWSNGKVRDSRYVVHLLVTTCGHSDRGPLELVEFGGLISVRQRFQLGIAGASFRERRELSIVLHCDELYIVRVQACRGGGETALGTLSE